jgi:hypothetical protein
VHNRNVRARRGTAVIFVLCVAYAAYSILTRPATPFTTPDTVAYVNASPVVPIGYPLFLKLAGVDGAAVLQPLVFATSLALLGSELAALTGTVLLPIVVIAAIVLTPEMQAFHASILTESLFVSGLVAFLAAMTRFTRAPTWRAALLAACIAGLTAMVRRTAVTFAVIVAFLIGVADLVGARALHGNRLTSLTGRHLFAKAALIDAPAPAAVAADALQARLAHELDASFAGIRALLAAAPREIRPSLTLYYETCLQWPCVSALRESLERPDAALNDHFAAAALARIRRAPGEFASLTLTHYISLWTVFKLQHPDTLRVMSEFLAAHRPLPFERETFKVQPSDPIEFTPWEPVRWGQPAVLGVGVFTVGIAAIGIAQAIRGTASTTLVVAALASLTAHASLLFSALAAAGISRFMLGIFPAVIMASVLGLWWLVGKWLRASHAPLI